MTVAGKTSTAKGTIQAPGVDKDACRLEYVSSMKSLAEVARQFGVGVAAMRRWNRDEGWDAARAEYRERFLQETTQSKIDSAAARLAQWNEETLLHAGLLREAARRQFQYQVEGPAGKEPVWRFRTDSSAKDISAAAAAYVASDKLARLALGASTDNVNNVNKSLPATVDDFF